ncbi:heterocycloanthracin/sonorensin family bacteriocin [Cohnella luojiensis]|uniref:Heterocycloanthracin/sonorensin family bacteriocin n=1 Tax=Cohnella luojiensis TaxID=652876 RepID=A0A4Y8M755_9BACL|nr:heterocycloanthracin/sonorensin family bacteriocin [Cohnella luojiensis]
MGAYTCRRGNSTVGFFVDSLRRQLIIFVQYYSSSWLGSRSKLLFNKRRLLKMDGFKQELQTLSVDNFAGGTVRPWDNQDQYNSVLAQQYGAGHCHAAQCHAHCHATHCHAHCHATHCHAHCHATHCHAHCHATHCHATHCHAHCHAAHCHR